MNFAWTLTQSHGISNDERLWFNRKKSHSDTEKIKRSYRIIKAMFV